MDVRQQTILVSNHLTWELNYQEGKCPKETLLSMTAALVGSIVGYPMLFLGGTIMFTHSSYNYLKSTWNQSKLINVLSDNNSLKKYAENRIKCCEKQIEDLKTLAIFYMEGNLKKLSQSDLPIPQKKTIKDRLSLHLPKSYWKDFQWDKFQSTDFFQKSNTPSSIDKISKENLETIRIKLNYLSHQKKVLSNPKENERLEAIKRIAELSFVKNGFTKQGSKEWMTHSFLWMFPSGIFWDLYFNSPNNDRLTYEGKKDFLPNTTNLSTFTDFMDAHNQLVRKHDFLVPHIQHTII